MNVHQLFFTKILLITSLTLLNVVSVFASEKHVTTCAPQSIVIKNESSMWISVIGIRWLNEDTQKWVLQPINNEYIQQDANWSTSVTPWDLDSKATFYQLVYRFLEDETQMHWSETKITSHVHVQDCQQTEQIEIRVVNLR